MYLEEEAAEAVQADLLDTSVGRCAGWGETPKADPGNTGGIPDPLNRYTDP